MFRRKYLSPREASHRFVARPAINADDKVINRVTRAPAFLFLPPMTGQTLCCVHTAKALLRPYATWQEVSLIVAVYRRRL